jgi:predicted RNase H-like HicB family nuclease
LRKNEFILSTVNVREVDGYSGLCLDVDIASDGNNPEEARENLIEAVNLYVETAIENNLPVIRPVPLEENPIFTRADDVQASFKIKVDREVFAHA